MRRFKGVYALSFVVLLLLMGGYLFRLGDGPFFAPLGRRFPFSTADPCLTLLSGLLTALLLYLVNRPIRKGNQL